MSDLEHRRTQPSEANSDIAHTTEALKASYARPSVLPPEANKDKTRRVGHLPLMAGGAAVAIAAVAGGLAFNSLSSDKEAPEKAPGQTLVLGPDGEPVQYVEYGEGHTDRDNDGMDDRLTLGPDNTNDSLQLWDQEKKQFVNPGLDEANEVLANASPEDLSDIATIQSTFPDFQISNSNWEASYVQLDPIVKRYVMNVVNSPEDFATSFDQQLAVMAGFDYTAEDLEKYLAD